MNDPLPVIVTHEGRHHADEILACWFFRILWGDTQIIRTSDPALWAAADVLLDVGAKYDPVANRFDHHGAAKLPYPPQGRACGYATAGLVWRLYGPLICERIMQYSNEGPWHSFEARTSPEDLQACYRCLASILDQELVAPIDAWDLGIYPPRHLSRTVLPFQWLLPHLDFDDALEALGKAFVQRLRILAETVAEEKLLEDNLILNGPCEFYVYGPWLVVKAPDGRRLEMKAAKRFACNIVRMPLLATLSSIRGGTRWGAFFLGALPASIHIPGDLEYASGRRTVFHDDPDRLLNFVRECAEQNVLPIPELRVGSAHGTTS